MARSATKKSTTQSIFCLFCLLLCLFTFSLIQFSYLVNNEHTPNKVVAADFIVQAKQRALHLEEAHADQLLKLESQLQNFIHDSESIDIMNTHETRQLSVEKDHSVHESSGHVIPTPLGAASTWTHIPPTIESPPIRAAVVVPQRVAAEPIVPAYRSQPIETTGTPSPFSPIVVIMAHNRPEYLEKTLSKLLNLVQDSKRDKRLIKWKVCVSLDSPRDFPRMRSKVRDVTTSVRKQRSEHELDDVKVFEFQHGGGADALIAISKHVKFALDSGFQQATHVVLLEEDLMPSLDFLFYFESTAWLLDADETLWCISAWNDNGSPNHAKDDKLLLRTSYFPGLGWMLRREDWVNDLAHRWPLKATTGWDHWIRRSTNNKNRDCVFPEVPRTKHIATHGTNVGAAEQKRYDKFAFSDTRPTSFGDLSYLKYSNYHAVISYLVETLPRISGKNLRSGGSSHSGSSGGGGGVRLYSREKYLELAREYNLSPGEARGYSRGVLLVRGGGTVSGRSNTEGLDVWMSSKKILNPTDISIIKTFTNKLLTKDRILLVDRRSGSGFLTNEEAMLPNPNAIITKAMKGASCSRQCSSMGKTCQDVELEYVNNCESLLNHFPCEGGCGHQIGLEIPVYVSDSHAATFKQCLVTEQKMPKCTASHKYTSRLCACV